MLRLELRQGHRFGVGEGIPLSKQRHTRFAEARREVEVADLSALQASRPARPRSPAPERCRRVIVAHQIVLRALAEPAHAPSSRRAKRSRK